ncbi:type II toxin-antitoxin system RelE/ParE family toxin [Sandaracinobacter neustonicus]|uniref:Type II toxin-antitoxin system RelE/ParE family toxin n=1 Tax=Sandaracinobacter neustonicus TaxID=1715348 RepID=A0A501XVI2_9SPHN|nr:type II toxin-antitoxin system RelE/ParE family toxin [Sandaracinobacter neustonicus]TPE64469.1 type II toxin-antitoxin system RelE/ParE family toxin [Sandaracinobacter neustonicus]
MTVQWTSKASSDLVRLYQHLSPVAPEAAARVVQQLSRAPDRLLEYPRLGEKLEAYAPREVRRIIVGNYEMRYEIAGGVIFVLRLWHCREDRGSGDDKH